MSNDNFDKKLDKALSDYDKGFDKLAPKLGNAADKVGRGLNRLFIGCMMILVNLFFGALCLWGVYAATVTWKLETSGEITTGIVTRLEENKSPDGSCCSYVPVVEFQVDGQTYSFEHDIASYPPEYQVGSEVKVRYDPIDPNTAQINTFSGGWVTPIIAISTAIFSSLILSFMMIRAWRRGEDVLKEALA